MAAFYLPKTPSQTLRLRAALLKAGMSVSGIDQLTKAEPVSSPHDRRAVVNLIDMLLSSAGDAAASLNKFAPEFKPRKPEGFAPEYKPRKPDGFDPGYKPRKPGGGL